MLREHRLILNQTDCDWEQEYPVHIHNGLIIFIFIHPISLILLNKSMTLIHILSTVQLVS